MIFSPYYNGGGDDSSSGSDSSADFVSPFPAFRPSLLPKSPGSTGDILPQPLHDSSWIGARMSPIASFHDDYNTDDDLDDMENHMITEPYRKALHDSMETLSMVNERTALLASSGNNNNYHHSINVSKKIHPLWETTPIMNNRQKGGAVGVGRYNSRGKNKIRINWANVVCMNCCIYFAVIALYDFYLWYISYRLGRGDTRTTTGNANYNNYNNLNQYDDDNASSALSSNTVNNNIFASCWNFPFFSPDENSMINFGAFTPDYVLYDKYGYYRILSSMFLCASTVELLLVIYAWKFALTKSWPLTRLQQLKQQNGNHGHGRTGKTRTATKRWMIVYILSILTGQLWMIAWDHPGKVCGCASWGTAGVLCAIGTAKPTRRFHYFMTTIAILLLNLMQQPYASVLGVVGASCFGWAFYCVNVTRLISKHDKDVIVGGGGHYHHPLQSPQFPMAMRLVAGVIVLLLWIFPLLTISVREQYAFDQ